jgi:DNA-binding response OmpR family regulator
MPNENIHILVAEDEEELREYLVEYLQLFFKNVYAAKCGQEAYKLYLEKKPEIILSDINMPNMDGLSMISLIRKRDQKTKIIVMSAYSDREKLLNAIELNLITYLVKPIKLETLKEIVLNTIKSIESTSSKIHLEDDIYWDREKKTLHNGAKQIILKDKESMLMELLCSKVNSAFSTENIFYKLYGNSEKEYSEYAITSLVKRLRTKLPKNSIQNEYGSGYKITLH